MCNHKPVLANSTKFQGTQNSKGINHHFRFVNGTLDLRSCSIQVNLVSCNSLAQKSGPKTPVKLDPSIHHITKQFDESLPGLRQAVVLN